MGNESKMLLVFFAGFLLGVAICVVLVMVNLIDLLINTTEMASAVTDMRVDYIQLAKTCNYNITGL